MRETFSGTVHSVLERAQAEARGLNQEFVGTEHLLLGILGCGECEAARVLQLNHVTPEKLRGALMRGMPKGAEATVVMGNLPLSPKSQRAVNTALVKAQSLREARVTTRLLLLSLLDEPETLVREALRETGADVDALLQKLGEKAGIEEA